MNKKRLLSIVLLLLLLSLALVATTWAKERSQLNRAASVAEAFAWELAANPELAAGRGTVSELILPAESLEPSAPSSPNWINITHVSVGRDTYSPYLYYDYVQIPLPRKRVRIGDPIEYTILYATDLSDNIPCAKIFVVVSVETAQIFEFGVSQSYCSGTYSLLNFTDRWAPDIPGRALIYALITTPAGLTASYMEQFGLVYDDSYPYP